MPFSSMLFCLSLLYFAFSQTPEISLVYENVGVGWGSSPAYYEKADGTPIIVFSSYWAIYCVNARTGEKIWTRNLEERDTDSPDYIDSIENRIQAGIVLVEGLRSEGEALFVVGCNHAEVSVFDIDGNVLTTRVIEPLLSDQRPVWSLSAVKIRETDPWRIVVGLPTTILQRHPNTHILDPFLLEVTPPIPVAGSEEGSNSLGVIGKNIACADLDGDGQLEIIVPSDEYTVAIWKFGTSVVASTQFEADESIFYNSNGMWSKVIFSRNFEFEYRGWAAGEDLRPYFARGITTVIPVELFADGFAAAGRTDPIVAVSGLYHDFSSGSPVEAYHTVFLLNTDRTRLNHDPGSGGDLWDWTLSYEGCSGHYYHADWQTIPGVEVQISYADLTGDGLPEIIFPCSDGRLHAVTLDQRDAGLGWPFDLGGTALQMRFPSEAAIFQKGGLTDGPMVIFTTWGPISESPAFTGELIILDREGFVVDRISLPDPPGGGTNGGKVAPTLFRFSPGENLHAAVLTRSSGLCLYELLNTEDATILWQTDRGSFERNGALGVPHQFYVARDKATTASIVGWVLGGISGGVLAVAVVVVIVLVVVLGRSAAAAGPGKKKPGSNRKLKKQQQSKKGKKGG